MQSMDILLVDDDTGYRTVLQDMLKTRGYATYTAGNGLEAAMILKSEEIDLIISDIKMPQFDGLRLYDVVRGLDRYKSVKFVFLSAYREYACVVAKMKAGTTFFLDKRMPEEELLRFIDMLMFGKYAGTWV